MRASAAEAIGNSHGSDVPAPDRALLSVGQYLLEQAYRFTTVSPASHGRVNARRFGAPTLRDIFGWSRPFDKGDLPDTVLSDLRAAGALLEDGKLRSAVRFSSLGEQLFAHSAFPTDGADAVFFGPDTYRFARTIQQAVSALTPTPFMRILDIGAGSGAGGIYAGRLLKDASPHVVLSDINRDALRLSRINAELNVMPNVRVVESNLYAGIEGQFELIVSNPPYLVDSLARLYRHGGGELGFALSVDIAVQGVEKLAPGGRLVLYTGSAIVDGTDLLQEALAKGLAGRGIRWSYEEIDPDVFGEELEVAPYDRADRIAVVAATIERP
jgi:SAM-dependent methyltransferase